MFYPFDVVPGFWNKLVELSNNGFITSIDKVKLEICKGATPDRLAEWCVNDLNPDFFVDTSSCVDIYSEIAVWAQSSQLFTQSAKDDFLATDLADPWLVAYAKKNGCIVVTHEVSQPSRKNKIKIPEVCLQFSVRYLTPIEMFRELHESF